MFHSHHEQDARRVFDATLNDFLDGYWKANPTTATSFGVHQFDAELDPASREAREAEGSRLRAFQGRIESEIPAAGLDRDRRIDGQILLDQIRSAILEISEVRSWQTNPGFYVELLGNSLLGLLKREFAPAEDRAQSLLSRLSQTPRLLTEARANLNHPPRLFTETALRLIPGTVDFLERKLLPSLPRISDELQRRIAAQAERSAASLKDFGRYLQEDLLPVSDGDYRLGPDLFRRKFRLALGTDLEPEEVLARARRALQETHREMEAVSRQVDPGASLPEILAAASRRHPRPEGLLQAFRGSVAAVKDFIRSRDLITLPEPELLLIEPAPPFFAIQGAFCDCPGPFEPHLASYYYVSELTGFSPTEQEELLQDNNDFVIPIVTIHEAYPGHYVQFVYQNRSPSLVRKVFWNGPFVEGWAHYAEQMMVEEGFRVREPGIRLFLLKNQTRAQLNAILDILLHCGQITEEAAVALLKGEGWQPEIVARKKVERAGLTSTQLSTYFLGRSEILDLRERYRTRTGPRYTLKGFHEALMGIGSPPLPCARQILLQDGEP